MEEDRESFIARMQAIQTEINRECDEYLAERANEVATAVRPSIARLEKLEGDFICRSNYCLDPNHKSEAEKILREWHQESERSYGFFNGFDEFPNHCLALGGYVDGRVGGRIVWRTLIGHIPLQKELGFEESSKRLREYGEKYAPKRNKR